MFLKGKPYITGASLSPAMSQREMNHRLLARQMASEGIVLLENHHNMLPIKPGKVALYGSGASCTIKGGTGSGEVNERYAVSIMQGLENAGFEITTKRWIDEFEHEYALSRAQYALLKAKTNVLNPTAIIDIMKDPPMLPYGRVITQQDIEESQTDTAIYIVARQAGEGTDKKLDNEEFHLTWIEKENLKILAQNYARTILVINSGAQMDLGEYEEFEAGALLYFCQQGEEGGNALADLLTGKVTPSGKLTSTWLNQYEDLPFGEEYSYLNGDTKHACYKEGIFVGYRYFDTFDKPCRYPFGYGQSYTTFAIEPTNIQIVGDAVQVVVKVTNTGGYPGKEVVQLYASCPQGTLDKEYQRLVDFEKTHVLKPGHFQSLVLTFPIEALTSYHTKKAAWILEKGMYLLRIGNSSVHTRVCALLENEKLQTLVNGKNLCGSRHQVTELFAPKETIQAKLDKQADQARKEGVVQLAMPKLLERGIVYCDPKWDFDGKTMEILHSLTPREMIELVVGAGYETSLQAKYIAAFASVGKSTDKLWKKGIPGVNFSDGPAGLRIAKAAAVRKSGLLRTSEFTMSFMEFLPRPIKSFMLVNPKKDVVLYQHVTAFPVETAMAQSWNQKLCKAVGQAMGEEMNEYLVTYWLAPALNIQKNPLGGRNFEYYSEDPIVSGKIAAAVVQGVQTLPGTYAVIKHFAANNQESDRTQSDSIVDERALREIYLKGFAYCIQASKPAALMSSYNKLNGIYTADDKALLTGILRNEWGFEGLVMTDWYATAKGLASNVKCINAGNDLIMPGTGRAKKQLAKALQDHTLSYEALRLSAARVIDEFIHSNVALRFLGPDKDKDHDLIIGNESS